MWACRVRSDQAVRVSATWAPLDRTTLGSAGPALFRDFDGAPARGVWYPAALADALAGRDLGDGGPDVTALFNSDFRDWHFGPGPPPQGTYDLATIVLHELGHGLGVIGSLAVEGGVGQLAGGEGHPFSYDLHAVDGGGAPLLGSAYPPRGAALADALEREVRFDGRAVRQATGGPVPLYAPRQWVPGGSFSHLDEGAFAPGTPDGLMTPFVAREEVVTEPGAAVCAVLADVGWTLAGDCAARVGALAPVAGGVTASRAGPNPFAASTAVVLTSAAPVALRVRLLDVLGRVVADYGTAVLVGGREARFDVDGRSLAAGVYVLSAVGGPERVAVPLVVAR